VAKIQPTSKQERKDFRQGLAPEQREAFDDLAGLIDAHRTDLAWYHEVGVVVARLLPPEFRKRGRVRWLEKPADALGPRPTLFQKSLRFTELYPHKKDVSALEAMGVGWTQICLTFVIPDREERHKLLRRAIAKGWAQNELRFEAQAKHPTRRHGVGGRPRKPVTAINPEATLREMGRVTQSWLDFHEGAWAKVKTADWKRLVRDWPEEGREQLGQLLKETISRLDSLLGMGKDVRRTLKELMAEV
jgi:hypothetical protein